VSNDGKKSLQRIWLKIKSLSRKKKYSSAPPLSQQFNLFPADKQKRVQIARETSLIYLKKTGSLISPGTENKHSRKYKGENFDPAH
jgi:hypothetical protein